MKIENLSGMTPCPDCVQCQMCSRSRCRICRKGHHKALSPQPGVVGLTHGAYLEWKKERDGRRADENASP